MENYIITIDYYSEKVGGNMSRYYYKGCGSGKNKIQIGGRVVAKRYLSKSIAIKSATKMYDTLKDARFVSVSVYDNNAKRVFNLSNVE